MSKHPIVHIEFSAKDHEKAGKFYSQLFGWKIEQHPEMHYATFEAEGGPGGGFNPVSEDYPAGTVMIYIQTDDIDVTLAEAEKLGAKTLVPKSEIPNTGWFGIFSDLSGNKVGLYTDIDQ